MTRNRVSNSMRGRISQIAFLERYSMFVIYTSFQDWTLNKECDRIFEQAISELSYQQREIFILKYYGFKPRVIAKKLKLKPVTVSNTLALTKKKLEGFILKKFEINEFLIKQANETCE
jgi:RNA polymerase sigma factor (sigma-70 family)